jgi:hypothetical protein
MRSYESKHLGGIKVVASEAGISAPHTQTMVSTQALRTA